VVESDYPFVNLIPPVNFNGNNPLVHLI